MKKLIVASLLIASCNNGSEGTTSADSLRATTDTAGLLTTTPAVAKNDTTITLQFEQGSNTAALTADLVNGKPVNVLVNVNKGGKLMAVVRSVTPGLNIRINQLFTPSGRSDGPFGNQINYKAADSGTYRIVVGSNLMAEGILSGKFNMVVGVENKEKLPTQ